ncbi:MAG: proton-conducting transporter membrane subunit [Oligoflexus sp.]
MNITVFPILIPLIGFCLALFFRRNIGQQKSVTILASILHVLLTLTLLRETDAQLSLQSAGWIAPFGISLTINFLSLLMLAVASVMYLVISLYSIPNLTAESSVMYFPLLNIIIAGICGAFLTADIFNLYVWFELILLSSFALISLEGNRKRLRGAFTYAIMSVTGSMLFLLAVGLIYGATGTLNMADLAVKLDVLAQESPGYVLGLSLLLFVAFSLKAAIWPFYFWLPDSYHLPSSALSSLFAALLTKVGIYAIFRVLIAVFPHIDYLSFLAALLAAMTMLLGVLGAVAQYQTRKILTYHSVSQVGYIVAGAAFMGADDPDIKVLGLAAGIFFMIQYIFVKAALFLVSGIILVKEGSEELKYLGAIKKTAPMLSILFVISAMSLAGVPPFSGFWAKYLLLRAFLLQEFYLLAGAMLVTGFFTIFSMVKIWNEAFWKPQDESVLETSGVVQKSSDLRLCFLALFILTAITMAISLYPMVLYDYSQKAAMQIFFGSSDTMDPAASFT